MIYSIHTVHCTYIVKCTLLRVHCTTDCYYIVYQCVLYNVYCILQYHVCKDCCNSREKACSHVRLLANYLALLLSFSAEN